MQTTFVPEVTIGDWLGLAALVLLIVLVIAFGCIAVRSAARRSLRAMLPVGGLILVGIAGLFRLVDAKVSMLSEVRFTPSQVRITSVGRDVVLPLRPGNKVATAGDETVLISGGTRVPLSQLGSWRLDDLVVGSSFLANEFAGRSREASTRAKTR
ncbi:MAG TPA: hypothetical protein VFG65_09070 [Fimbriimonadales bacterium]|jgi:hypothetical protein|nr:hypothetical protein [Fimbriimonadales bacterium]